jgi:hypothetical protein
MKGKSVVFSISVIVIFSMVIGLTTTSAQGPKASHTADHTRC